MATIINACKTFFTNVILPVHNNPEFFRRWLDNIANLETQLLVSPAGGYPVEGSHNVWTDGSETWWSIRWPKNAATEPYFRDTELDFLIENHWEGIGTTWWDWVNRESVGLGFDFDAITGHAPGTGISEEELELVRQKASSLDYVDVLRSSGGSGIHLYLWFESDARPKTANHTEHSALGRAMLGKLSTDAGFDFGSHLDVCGGNMWIGHKKMSVENCGFQYIKRANRPVKASEIPVNWKDHLDVIGKKSTRVRVLGVDDNGNEINDPLDTLTSARVKHPLNETHRAIINDLEMTGYTCVWIPDHHLVQTHTVAIKSVVKKWLDEGHPMRGFFDTISPGNDNGKPNCLAGDTRVLTREGLKPIRDLAGKTVDIITKNGRATRAPFKSYGEQEVFAITLRNSYGHEKVIRATGDHRWFVFDNGGKTVKDRINFAKNVEITTSNLKKGQILIQSRPQGIGNLRPSIVGIQHGLVWGAGTAVGSRRCDCLPLFGKKDAELLRFFVGHPRRTLTNSIGGTEITGLPKHFKSLVPLHYDKAYLYGWLAGYFAADGCVSDSGVCKLCSSSKDSIEHVREVGHILGIEVYVNECKTGPSSYIPGTLIYTATLKAANLTSDFFLLSTHRKRFETATSYSKTVCWRVESVEPAGIEEVFCCTVPETGCFVLEDFILTGNCFLIPGPHGSFMVYRFGKGTAEHPLWNQDRDGWTWCHLNRQPTLSESALAMGGVEDDSKGGFHFDETAQAISAVNAIGAEIKLPEGNKYEGRHTVLRKHKDGRLIVEIDKFTGDHGFEGWVDKKKKWVRVYNINTEVSEEVTDYSQFDSVVRSIRTPSNVDAGWMIRVQGDSKDGVWVKHPESNAKKVLRAQGLAPSQVDVAAGDAIMRQWTIVNLPFHEEFPGGRQWNLGAPQLRFNPIDLPEGQKANHPHWDLVLSHCGADLTEIIQGTDWCKQWGIYTGADYLETWIACMFREPFEPLPYLFMYGPQNSGKSIFHEAVSLLVTGGVVKADRALTNQNDFNGELANAVFGVVDEVNINQAGPSAYNKIKEWVTGKYISIHQKKMTVYQQRNCLHLIQMSNFRDAVPVFPGDTRITMMYVGPLLEEIPKQILLDKLEAEGPAIMHTLMTRVIPASSTRLRLPILETEGKHAASVNNMDTLETFISENCYEVYGSAIELKDFYNRFISSLTTYEQKDWSKRRVRRGIPEQFPIGNWHGNKVFIGNLSFDEAARPTDELCSKAGRLVKKKDVENAD